MEIQTNSYAGEAACLMALSTQINDIGLQVGKVECGVKESILSQSLAMGTEFCGINKNIADHSHRNVIEILANRAATKEAECNVIKHVDMETDLIKLQLNNFQTNVAKELCEVKCLIKDSAQAILKQLSDDKLDEKNDEIAELRACKNRLEDRLIIGNEISAIKNMVNSIEQTQRFSSKTVQFGAGNVATPVQTANQG